MGARAVITFKDKDNTFHVYQRDGDPGEMIDNLRQALDTAWPLPRFEADQFAACYIHAGIQSYLEGFPRLRHPFDPCFGNGGMRLTKGPKHHFDLEWAYTVKFTGKLFITVQIVNGHDFTSDFAGSLDEFTAYVVAYKT